MQSRSNANLKGIDIANYQAGLNFALVKQAGIDIVYIKATEGVKYVNPYLRQHYQEAKAQGLKVGFYHYFWPTLDPAQQMEHFVRATGGMDYDCRPALDVEDAKGLTADQVSKVTADAMEKLAELTGHEPVIYTYTYFARSSLVKSYVDMYPLWIADYNSRGVPGSNPIWDSWIGYQYSSSGNIGGITIDMNEFTSDILIGGDEGVQKFEQQERVAVDLFGQERSDCVLIEVEGRPTTYIPAIALRESGHEVVWDEDNRLVIIKEAK